MFDAAPERMKKMAARRARRVQKRTDEIELAKDMEQQGWVAYLESCRFPEPVRWLNVQRAMNDYWCRWLFHVEYKQASKAGFDRVVPIEGLDLSPLASLDPTVEEQVLGIELMRRYEQAFQRGRNKFEAMLTAVLLSDSPRVARGLLPRLKLSRGGNPARMSKLKAMWREMVG